MFFEKTYEIDTRDLDCFDCCRSSAILGYLQDAAGLAADMFHAANPQMIARHGHCWMVVRTRYTLERPLRWRDKLTVKTWHRGGAKPLMYRDFDLIVNGEKAGEALSIWVLVNLADHSMTRPDDFPEFPGTDGGALIRTTSLPRLRLPADMPAGEVRALHYSDTDANGHVNNTRYADFICDALALHQSPPGTFVRQMQVEYLHECRAGETLTLHTMERDGQHFVLGAGADGSPRFHGLAVMGRA